VSSRKPKQARSRRSSTPSASPAKPTLSEQIDREVIADILTKRKLGQPITRGERGELRRWERARDEEARWAIYKSIPKRHWRAMSGRQDKVLNEQALRYGIPFGGATINLVEVARALHDFLAENHHKLNAVDGDDPLSGPTTPALERYREEAWRIKRIERQRLQGTHISRETIHDAMNRLAGILRGLGDRLRRQHGNAAGELLDEALDDFERQVSAFEATDDGG